MTLVPLADEHLEFEVELDSDPEVVRYLFARPRTREQTAARHLARRAEAVDGCGFWVGTVGGEPVGWWLLTRADDGAELGYRLLRRWWRRGLATEGARELLRHAFEDLRIPRVWAETMAVNTGSRAVMTAIGLRYERTYVGRFDEPLPGAAEGEVVYGLNRDEWPPATG